MIFLMVWFYIKTLVWLFFVRVVEHWKGQKRNALEPTPCGP